MARTQLHDVHIVKHIKKTTLTAGKNRKNLTGIRLINPGWLNAIGKYHKLPASEDGTGL